MTKVIRYFLLYMVTQPVFAGSVTIECRGEGPSLDVARMDADRICLNSMATRLDSEIDIKAASVETEKETAYHSEITRNGSYEGLTCKPENERVEETPDQVIVKFTCRYDLAKVKRVSKHSDRVPADTGKRIISLATVPYCTDILVRGLTSRVVPCGSNPVRLTLKSSDEAITVRAPKSMPKTLQKGELNESSTVYLDPAR
jgi:hypothetical protein